MAAHVDTEREAHDIPRPSQRGPAGWDRRLFRSDPDTPGAPRPERFPEHRAICDLRPRGNASASGERERDGDRDCHNENGIPYFLNDLLLPLVAAIRGRAPSPPTSRPVQRAREQPHPTAPAIPANWPHPALVQRAALPLGPPSHPAVCDENGHLAFPTAWFLSAARHSGFLRPHPPR